MILQIAILGLTTAQRLGELGLARANTRKLMAQGAVEVGAGHYPYMVLMHAAWLLCLWVFGRDQSVQWAWLIVFAACQGLRVWTLMTLGPRWTTRIIVLPGAPLVRSGPYRYFPHPNYLVVVVEIAALPLTFGLWGVAVLFSVLNGLMLWVRIRAENAALKSLGGDAPGY